MQGSKSGPHENPVFLTVVEEYKHVGSMITADGNPCSDAALRAKSAAKAYTPLACKLFARPRMPIHLRLQFAESLVFSRLFYNVELWGTCHPNAIRAINN
eukprot:837336-Karenia_brevis.AAC.1